MEILFTIIALMFIGAAATVVFVWKFKLVILAAVLAVFVFRYAKRHA